LRFFFAVPEEITQSCQDIIAAACAGVSGRRQREIAVAEYRDVEVTVLETVGSGLRSAWRRPKSRAGKAGSSDNEVAPIEGKPQRYWLLAFRHRCPPYVLPSQRTSEHICHQSRQ
jgi:hypothetical protein